MLIAQGFISMKQKMLKEDAIMQIRFLERAKAVSGDDVSFAQVLSLALSVSLDSAYRRIRGEIPLTFMEIAKISELYGLSFDNLFSLGGHGSSGLKYRKVSGNNFEQDVTEVWEDMEGLLMHENVKISVLSSRLPLDRLAKRPALLKLYYNMSLGIKAGYSFAFGKEDVPTQMKELATSIYFRMQRVPAVYILSPNWQFNFMHDLAFLRKIGKIKDAEVPELQEEMLELLAEMEKEAKKGRRNNGAEIEILLSQLSFDGVSVLIETEHKLSTLTILHEVSYAFSENLYVGKEYKSWIEHIKNHSMCISKSGALERKHFFEKQREMVRDILG